MDNIYKKITQLIVDKILSFIPFLTKEYSVYKNFLIKQIPDLTIATTNLCNAKCSFCAYRYMKRKKSVADEKMVYNIIDEYANLGGGNINFTATVGEPLLDKNLITYIKYARSKSEIKKIFFYTNLIALTEDKIKPLLTSGITRIAISTCLGGREMYHKLFNVDKYDHVFKMLIKVIEKNNELSNPVNITIHLRGDRSLDETQGKDYLTLKKLIDKKNIYPKDDNYDNWNGLITQKDLPEGAAFFDTPDVTNDPCFELYRKLVVCENSEITFCTCRDIENTLAYAKYGETSLSEAWKSEQLNSVRDNWENDIIPPVCKSCNRYVGITQYILENKLKLRKIYLKQLLNNVTKILKDS